MDNFLAEMDVPVYNRFKKRKVDNEGNYVSEKVGFKEGRPNQEFLDRHKLGELSQPYEWFDAFCPTSLTSMWTSFTNLKATKMNAGIKGRLYLDFKPFGHD